MFCTIAPMGHPVMTKEMVEELAWIAGGGAGAGGRGGGELAHCL